LKWGDKLTDSAVAKVFREHLERFLYSFQSYKKVAEKLGVSESSIKSWLSGRRTPSIRTLDRIANRIGCSTYQLIKSCYPIECGKSIHNVAHIPFRKKLDTIFIERQCFSLTQKLNLLQNRVSDLMLTSYLRTRNNRLPTLRNLEVMAQALGIETYELLLWEE